MTALGTVPALAGTPPTATTLQSKAESKVLGQLDRQDEVTFWVQLDSTADTSKARAAKGKTAKARAVYQAETAHAERSQAGLRALLDKAGARYKSFWVANTVKVTADKALAEKIAARSDVASLEADDPVELPDPLPSDEEPTVDGVEWNVDRINAPRVWSELGVRGEGVVVANIDSGVAFDHPAVAAKYRGLKSDGTYDHNYNWFDPASVCAGGVPCDNNSHGTHTMGTMVGDDGAGNQVGVAPGAKWIAAKGCETSSCSRESLLASGQWVVAPTDSAGQNPRPDLSPDVVNNSWGANVLDTWYKQTVQSWRDAGIFPAFSNGNAGPGCNTSGSPGSYVNSYSSGAFNSSGAIASFSSRGTGESGGIKPNIASPGENVRSSIPGGYGSKSGTSMASPHTAATVALMWSASPAIRGDVAATEALLNQTAVDTGDTTCGGTAANNNVWGEGKLDAFAAVNATPRGPLGAVGGTVTSGGTPLADATVKLSGPMQATLTTAADGTYGLPKVMVGDYTVSVTKYGYLPAEASVTILEGQTATRDIAVEAAPSGRLTGVVRSGAGPEAGAKLVAQGTPVSATTGADGSYAMTLPFGAYELNITPAGRCAAPTTVSVKLSADAVQDIDLADRLDTAGTSCRESTGGAFPEGETKVTMSSTTTGSGSVPLPFPVALYGRTYRTATATTEGVLAFGTSSTSSSNVSLPSTGTPNGALYPFWDNMSVDASAGVYWSQRGTAPHREVVVEWRNAVFSLASTQRVTFSVVIGEDGTYSYHYKDIGEGSYENGSAATIGTENATGTDALLYSYNQPAVKDGMSISFRTTKSAVVSGTVTDDNDGLPVAGAAVTVGSDGVTAGTDTTDASGAYLVQVPATSAGSYDVAVSAAHYEPGARTADVEPQGVSRAGTVLKTGVVKASALPALTLAIPAGQQRTRTFTLSNTGSAASFSVAEKGGAPWLTAAPASGSLAKGASQQVTLTFDTAGAAPGSVLRGTLAVTSESGRAPVQELPVTVVVPAYQAALDTGAEGVVPRTDGLGDTWTSDAAYAAGSYGYVGNAGLLRTSKSVAGTSEQELYRTARTGALEYRFDGLADGVYQVELGFAEISGTKPGARVFDVMAEGTEKLANVDVALEAGGSYKAYDRTFTITVTDGQLNLRLVELTGKSLINTLRITHRPDLEG
ncbi:S8 family serine peptidase [Streptomyces sp. NPDC051940]|uniref:S8 family serine peptidase n=1 Tax=Streptomyces sp. NPDC051940 TaxID=3155675 RepID=UPI003422BFB3